MDARLFVKRNASTILTGLDSIGVIATTITEVKATPKALRLIEEAEKEKEKEKGEKITKWETVKIASPSYISTAGLCLATMACVIGAEILNQKRQASLLSACVLLDQSYKDYQRILNSHKLHCL